MRATIYLRSPLADIAGKRRHGEKLSARLCTVAERYVEILRDNPHGLSDEEVGLVASVMADPLEGRYQDAISWRLERLRTAKAIRLARRIINLSLVEAIGLIEEIENADRIRTWR